MSRMRKWVGGHRYVAAAGCVGLGGGIVIAAEVWDGGGANRKFSTAQNWVGDDHAPLAGANVDFVVPESGLYGCEWDSDAPDGEENDLGIVTITGSSPTVFTFHIKDKPCSVAPYLNMNDYSRIDADYDFSLFGTNHANFVDTSEIDVASGVTCYLAQGWCRDTNAVVSIVTAGSSDVDFDELHIDGWNEGVPANRALKLVGGGKVSINTFLLVRGQGNTDETDYPAAKAKLWVASVLVTAENLETQGGVTSDRQAEFDIDQNMIINTKTHLGPNVNSSYYGGGRVVIDIAAGKTLELGELVIDGPCLLTVTGTNPATGQVITGGSHCGE